MYGNPYMQSPTYNPMAAQQFENPFAQYFANLFQQNQQQQGFQQPQAQQGWTIPCVKGREGVDKFAMPPRSEALLMDEDDAIIWLVKTDDAGVKSLVKPLPFTLPEDPDKVAMSSLEERVKKLEEEMKRHVKPDYVDVAYTE